LSQATVSPSGVEIEPSGWITDPLGTSQTWNIDLGKHPDTDASSNVSTSADHPQAGMTVSPVLATSGEDEPHAATAMAAMAATATAAQLLRLIGRT
jgi:hypothetical protein